MTPSPGSNTSLTSLPDDGGMRLLLPRGHEIAWDQFRAAAVCVRPAGLKVEATALPSSELRTRPTAGHGPGTEILNPA